MPILDSLSGERQWTAQQRAVMHGFAKERSGQHAAAEKW
jgi:hypothetical protein